MPALTCEHSAELPETLVFCYEGAFGSAIFACMLQAHFATTVVPFLLQKVSRGGAHLYSHLYESQ